MRFLWLAFFLSGIAGISYELVWAKYLVRVFGATAPAVASAVSIFFAGLALGSGLSGRLFDRLANSLRGYGVLEIAIGVTAALVPAMVRLGERWLVDMGSEGETLAIRLGLAAVILLVPATLIGATFPAMAAVVRRLNDPTHRTALFYGFNTTGAVLGCVVTGFWLIPAVGLGSATAVMATLNIIIGVAILGVSLHPVTASLRSQRMTDSVERPGPGTSKKDTEKLAPSLTPVSAAVLALCSGLFAIGTEVLWVRALVLSFHGTVYVFATVLAAYLIGIGAGSLLLARLRRRVKHELNLLALLYVTIAIGSFVAMIIFPHLGAWSKALTDAGIVNGWGSHSIAVGLMALLAMLPATLAMGASLPLLIGLVNIKQHESRSAGMLYGLNTLGGILGSLLATFTLMPVLSLSGALMTFVVGYLALFAMLGIMSKRYLALAPFVLVLILGIAGVHPEVNAHRERSDAETLFYRDAPSGTIGIYEDQQKVRSMWINNYYGLSDTSPHSILLHGRIGHLPMLMHPQPKNALLIGFATGITLAAMAQYQLERLDCVELHPSVIEQARFFDSINFGVAGLAEVNVEAADGRRYLRQEGPAYDVIIGDLYLPANAGTGALYSLEHFEAAKQRLAPGGVFVAWLPLFQLGPAEVSTIARTFLSVFPSAELWMGNWGQRKPVVGLVGWNGADDPSTSRPTAGQIERRLWDMGIQEIGLEKQSQVQSRQLLPNELLRRWAKGGRINTLDHPVIEYSAPRATIDAEIQDDPLYQKNHTRITELLRPGER